MTQKETETGILTRIPRSVQALSERTGALLPAGAVIYAEGDTRNFHELLFIYHGLFNRQASPLNGTVDSLRETLSYYAARFQGWYELTELSDAIERMLKETDFKDKADLLDHMEILMRVTGRVNSGIDLLIPWDRINRAMRSDAEKPFR